MDYWRVLIECLSSTKESPGVRMLTQITKGSGACARLRTEADQSLPQSENGRTMF